MDHPGQAAALVGAERADEGGGLVEVVFDLEAVSGEDGPLIAYDSLGGDAMLSVPTPDHYLPLLYVLPLRHPGEPVGFPVTAPRVTL